MLAYLRGKACEEVDKHGGGHKEANHLLKRR
jgi:hypothetical protein